MIKRALLCFSALLASFILQCSTTNIVSNKGGVENGNGFVNGYIYTEKGGPAAHTLVKCIGYNNDPRFSDTVVAYAITDSVGKYSFDTIAPGVYNIFGQDEHGLLSYSDSLAVQNRYRTFPPDTVRIPGRFQGVVRLKPYSNSMVILVMLGTDLYTMTNDTIGNFISPKLAPGKYRIIIIATASEFQEKELVVNVESGKTTTLDTIDLAYLGKDTVFVPFDTATFQAAQRNLPGYYLGVASSLWVAPYSIALIIDSRGHYSAYTTDQFELGTAFSGSDDDSPLKQLSLNQINIKKEISGSITNVFNAGTSNISEIQGLQFSAAFDTLKFNMETINFLFKRVSIDLIPPRPEKIPTITLQGKQLDSVFEFKDSVTISMAFKGNYTIQYQFVDGINGYFSFDTDLWDDGWWSGINTIEIYTGPFSVHGPISNRGIIARAVNGPLFSHVKGKRIVIR